MTGASAEAGSGRDGVWAPGRRGLTTGLILTVTVVATEALAVSAVMPEVEAELGERWLYGWVFSGFFLGNLVGIVVAGRAADRVHPWRPFAAGLALFVAGLLAAGSARSMGVLVVARVAQGIGAGALPATAYVCIAHGYLPESRPRMFALLSTAWVVPGLFGPGLAAVVGDRWGWRWVFLGLLPVVVGAGTFAVRAVGSGIPDTAGAAPPGGVLDPATPPATPPETPPATAGPATLRAAVMLAMAAAVALAGLTTEVWVVGLPVAVLALVGATVPFRRLTPPGTLRARPGLPATVAARGLLTAAFFSADTFVSLALRGVRGTEAWVVGAALTGMTLTWAAGAWLQERTLARRGPRRLVRAGFSGLALAWAGAATGLALEVPVPVLLGSFWLAGLAMGPAYATISVTTLAQAAPGAEGRASSALQLTDVLGVALGAGLAGAVVAAGDSAGVDLRWSLVAVFGLAVALALGGVLVAGRLPLGLRRAPAVV